LFLDVEIQFCGAEACKVGAEEFSVAALPVILLYK
jgi:hypothetical protein